MPQPKDQHISAEIPTPHDLHRSWAERSGFADWILAVGWILVAFVLFQVVASIVAFSLIIRLSRGDLTPVCSVATLTEPITLPFTGNSAGQRVFLGLAT